MKKIIFLIPLLILCQSAYADVIIENDQKYTDEDGLLHIVGEIKNNSTVPLNQIQISATLIDSNGNKIGEIVNHMISNTIMPGMNAGFDILIQNVNSEIIDNYEVVFDYNLTNPKNQVIEITSPTLTKDAYNNTIITGVLENNGDITANMIKVMATLYDRNGNVVTISEIHVKPDFLRAGESSTFLIPFHEKSQSINAIDYSITAESDEFVTVPEFPLGTGILLIVSVSSYILFSRNPQKMINTVSRIKNAKKILRHKHG